MRYTESAALRQWLRWPMAPRRFPRSTSSAVPAMRTLRPPSAAFTSALDAFLELDSGVQHWQEASFEPVLQDFRKRFEATGSEEGSVMATALAYVIGDLRTSRRAAILDDFRTSGRILELFQQGLAELTTTLGQR